MRSRIISFLSLFLCGFSMPALANWQYPGSYLGDGAYSDDGSRFVVSFRGGASLASAGIKNDIGSLTSEYYVNSDGLVITAAYYDACGDACSGFEYAGAGELASLPAAKDFSSFAFAAGASVGWVIPNKTQWRIELGWDHVSESSYNSSPLFEGDMVLEGGNVSGVIVHAKSGGVQSKVSTDVISAMAYYDFFEGTFKPLGQAIPYVGFGIGYADSKTILNLSDLYGDLSTSVDLQNFGKLDDFGVLQFYRSEKSSANIAGVLAAGVSYGLSETMFLDLSARLMYIPKITWALTNEDGSRDRDWFSAENMFYTNVMLGVRFEF